MLTQVWTGPGASVGTFIVAAGGAEPALTGVAAQGSMSSQVAVLYTQSLLRLAGRGHDGAAWSGDQAAIMLKANEQWNATSHGTYLLFSATAKGTLPMVPLMVLNGSGNLLLGTSDPGTDNLTDRLQVNGTAYFSGRVTLSITPTAPLDGANKQYVDNQITSVQGAYLPLTAGVNFPLTDELYLDGTSTGNGATLHLTTPGWPAVVFNTTTPNGGTAAGYFASQRTGLNRWAVEFGGTNNETGGNVGTNFLINRFDDNGNVLYPSPFQIIRGTGVINIGTPLMLAGDAYDRLAGGNQELRRSNHRQRSSAKWRHHAGRHRVRRRVGTKPRRCKPSPDTPFRLRHRGQRHHADELRRWRYRPACIHGGCRYRVDTVGRPVDGQR